ncbi:nicotinate-nucleotide adenylyltransferase [Phormidium sp. CLA17]|uniref:nicotinate-nucleotide adenylyltransferase n=1 Tax=Leptolyngbya sp. Cla-17 TaxID=2803751 RepID=UPI001491753B|nr:nicotinate-nucleotide adenylyltransferase [Leptolyngbya sp. Cla-17]MBM0740928.1 nicotinate-nucleotide adenylyltransferase [Leptolyngbya sp. Cla-17]
MSTIALFGTSADPPTLGHQAILAWLSYRFDGVAVWASDNPLKTHQTPLAHRLEMLKLLIQDLQRSRPNVQFCPDLSQPRTIHTLEIAKRRWSTVNFTFVVGSDLVAQLPNWYQIEDLLREVNLLVVPRPGYPLSEAALEVLKQRGARVAIADLMGPDTSSTAYRNHKDTDGLTASIEDYIRREHLYECQDASPEKQIQWQIAQG